MRHDLETTLTIIWIVHVADMAILEAHLSNLTEHVIGELYERRRKAATGSFTANFASTHPPGFQPAYPELPQEASSSEGHTAYGRRATGMLSGPSAAYRRGINCTHAASLHSHHLSKLSSRSFIVIDPHTQRYCCY